MSAQKKPVANICGQMGMGAGVPKQTANPLELALVYILSQADNASSDITQTNLQLGSAGVPITIESHNASTSFVWMAQREEKT